MERPTGYPNVGNHDSLWNDHRARPADGAGAEPVRLAQFPRRHGKSRAALAYYYASKVGVMSSVVKISVPYIGMDKEHDATREWAHMTLRRDDGKPVCMRQVKRVVRKYLNAMLGRSVHTQELRTIIHRKRWSYA